MSIETGSHAVIAALLSRYTGQQITSSRRWRIETALASLFRDLGIQNIDQLACMVENGSNSALNKRVVEALLNNETYFFRDHVYFATLADTVLPALHSANRASKTLTVWSAGCSTGQEALSLAMLLAEQGRQWDGWDIRITGTDVSARAIEAAKRNCYSQFEVQRGISVARMLSFFSEQPDGWVPAEHLRSLLTFEKANILDGPPRGSPFDLVLCRNVLLYFGQDVRAKAFATLREATKLDGWLMLGSGETTVGQTDLFTPTTQTPGFYRPQPLPHEELSKQRLSA